MKQLLLASPRNQHSALQALLGKLNCKAHLAVNMKSAFAVAVQEAHPMPICQVPKIASLSDEESPPYPYQKMFAEAKDDTLVILHTSGTTAVPKPITYTNDWVAAYIQALRTQPTQKDPMWEMKHLHLSGNRLLVMMPPFHAANIFCTSFIAVAKETTIILPPANLPPAVEVFLGAIKNIHVNTAFVPPHLISAIATNQSYLNITASKLETLISGGGKVVEPHGDIVSSKVRLAMLYGATEIGSIPDIMPCQRSNDLWNYIKPHPAAMWQFRLHKMNEGEKIYEAWITKANSLINEPPVFKIYQDRNEYFTRDLFVEHPKVQGFWKWYGRIDDTICLRTGANVSPNLMENGLSELPFIQGVLMVGNGCPRPILLIEPRAAYHPAMAKAELLIQVWNSVERLNDHYFTDHTILRSHVILTDAGKPMIRSLKGSIQRSATVSLYESDIKRISGGFEDSV